jgi:hypothetical protein
MIGGATVTDALRYPRSWYSSSRVAATSAPRASGGVSPNRSLIRLRSVPSDNPMAPRNWTLVTVWMGDST